MKALQQEDWEEAARHLFEDEYSLVATGARVRDSWMLDAIAIMRREVDDPRGWVELEWDVEDKASGRVPPEYPFVKLEERFLAQSLNEVSAEAAAHQLVAMVDEWFTASSVPGFRERRDVLLDKARCLVSRFVPEAKCYSSSSTARKESPPEDFLHAGAGGSFTNLTMDLGLVVVSDSEVGVFWRFNAY